jgi:hypothetical protein
MVELSRPQPAYGYGPGYGPSPVYYRSGCYWSRQRVIDPYVGKHLRRVRVCN